MSRCYESGNIALAVLCIAYTMGVDVFDWDENNLRKIRAHRINPTEVEQALAGGPILIYEQNAGGESRYVYITARQIVAGYWPSY